MIELKSFPFDYQLVLNSESGEMEPDREYDAEIYRKYFAKFLSNGVYFGTYRNYGENSMKVSADGGLNIRIAKGAGLIEGADFELEEEKIITLERPTSGERIDRIIVRFDKTLAVRNTILDIKIGEGTTPAPLVRDDNAYEICLAEVTVRSTTNITEEDIVDKRLNSNLCGIVNSLISINGEELLQRFQEYIDEMTKNLVKKNEKNTITEELIVESGITGNCSSASKLEVPRKINVSGAINGSVDFDGSEDVTINTTQSNIAVFSGSTTIEASANGKITKDYPTGFNSENCVAIACGIRVVEKKGYEYAGNFATSADLLDNAYKRRVNLNSSNIVLSIENALTESKTFYYKLVLMKIS
jgi:hypothetical protein